MHMYSHECLKLQLLAIECELNLTLGCIIITLCIYYVSSMWTGRLADDLGCLASSTMCLISSASFAGTWLSERR